METREAILQAVGYAASSFLRASDWRESCQSLLRRLGSATAVDRIYVFENGRGPAGEPVASQRFEWAAEGVEPQIDDPQPQGLPYEAAGFERWARLLREGGVVAGAVSDLPPEEAGFLAAQGIASILVVPVFAGDSWWGFMGFDACREARRWSPSEIEALRVAAGALGASVERLRIQHALEETESRLRQIQKFEAIGQLAGGIAHDFNNLLTVIEGHVELLVDAKAPDDPDLVGLLAVRGAADRAASLTQQLLAFSRRQVLQADVVAIDSVVTGVAPMLRQLIGEDVELLLRLDPAAGNVLADPRQLEQVLVNLAVNARDAMPEGGTLTVATARRGLDQDAERAIASQPAGEYVVLSVSDTGVGMDPATQARIFEPFFTTKPVGRGTGLGLSTAYGIVKQSGGWIWCQSAPGQGTRFHIELPPAPPGRAASRERGRS